MSRSLQTARMVELVSATIGAIFMPVTVECPACHHAFAIPARMLGHEIRCPSCTQAFSAKPGALPPASSAAIAGKRGSTWWDPDSPRPEPAVKNGSSPVTEFPAEPSSARSSPGSSPALAKAEAEASRGPSVSPISSPASELAPPNSPRSAPPPAPAAAALPATSTEADLLLVLAVLGVVIGLLSWAATWLLRQGLYGGVAAVVGLSWTVILLWQGRQRNEGVRWLAVAGLLVNVQALGFAISGWQHAPAAPPPPPLVRSANDPTFWTISGLKKGFKAENSNDRLATITEAGKLARDLGTLTLDLLEPLRDSNADIRKATIETLAQLGPDARLAYPALVDTSKNDDSVDVRKAALLALHQIGQPSVVDVALFTENLKAGHGPLRSAAAQVLGLIGAEARPAMGQLRKALTDRDGEVRLSAAQALWQLEPDPQEVLPVFLEGLKHVGDPEVRARAAHGLGLMQAKAKAAVDDLLLALSDPNPSVQGKVVYALWSIGPEARKATPKLIELLHDRHDPKVRLYAAQALWDIDRQTQGLDVLKEALEKSRDTDIRLGAVILIGKMGRAARPLHPALRQALLADRAAEVRAWAAAALGKLGPDGRPGVEDLARALDDQDRPVQLQAVHALGEIGAQASAAAPALKQLLERAEPELRLHTAQALWAIEREPSVTVPALCEGLSDKNESRLRAQAAALLGKLRGRTRLEKDRLQEALREAVPPLLEMLRAEDSTVRTAAAETLGKIGSPARVAWAMLNEIATLDAQEEVRKAAVTARKEIGPPLKTDVDFLIEALAEKQRASVRIAAAQTLWLLNRDARKAVPALAKALNYPDENLRAAAAFALGSIGPDAVKAVPALLEALKQKDDLLRARVAHALGEIGPAAKDAIAPLTEVLAETRSGAVRLHAAQALWAIDKQQGDNIRELGKVLEEKEENLKLAAASVLAKIGPPATSATAALAKGLQDSSEPVRAECARALGAIGRDAAPAVMDLVSALEDGDAQVRAAAAEALGKIGAAENKVRPEVQARLAYPTLLFFSKVDVSEQVRREANQALNSIGRPSVKDVGLIRGRLDRGEATLPQRSAMIQLLSMIGHEAVPASETLGRLVTSDPEPSVRALAAYALGDIGPAAKEALPSLLAVLDRREEQTTRLAALYALGEMGPAAREAAAALGRLIDDPDEAVVRAARSALSRIQGK